MFTLPSTGIIALDSHPRKSFKGLDIVIETDAYTMRLGSGWMSSPPADYGYIEGTRGADGDEMDCYLGPNPNGRIFVVDQNRMDGPEFDEHKCMLGYDSEDEAKQDYINGHSDGRKIFRGIKEMSFLEFKKWLAEGDVTKPVTE